MEKKNLETFIKKYNLGGLLDDTRWHIKDSTLKISAITTDKKLLVSVLMKKFENIDNNILGVVDAPKLKQMLGALNDNVSVSLIVDELDPTRVLSIVVADDTCEVCYTTSAEDILQKDASLKALPTFGVEIIMSPAFIEQFSRAKSALPEVEAFTLLMNNKKKKLEMVFGHGKNNYNRISVDITAVADKNTVSKPISFSAKTLKAILDANTEAKDPVLKVSEDGMAFVEFDQDNFHSQYYMIRIDIED
jgi:hypothetical protein